MSASPDATGGAGSARQVERVKQRRIVEALILASPEPIPAARLAEIVPRGSRKLVGELVRELNAEYEAQGRAFEIWEVAGGFQVRTLPDTAPYVRQLRRAAALRLSRAALETLAIVAYRQPVTRAEVEEIRGVDAGAVLRGLIERRLVRIAGHRDVPGRPLLYATSRRFLEVFSLRTLKDLPTLRDLEELAAGTDGAVGPEDDPAEGEPAAEGGAPISDEELEAAAAAHDEDAAAADERDEDVLEAAADAIEAARATAASLRAAARAGSPEGAAPEGRGAAAARREPGAPGAEAGDGETPAARPISGDDGG